MLAEEVRALNPDVRRQCQRILEANGATWDWVKRIDIDFDPAGLYVRAIHPYEWDEWERVNRPKPTHWTDELIGVGVRRCPEAE